MREPFDERRGLEAHQVILGGEITQNLLAPGVERMDGGSQRRECRAAFRQFDLAVFTGPLVDILKEISMDAAKVCGVELAGDWLQSQFFTALPGRSVLKPA